VREEDEERYFMREKRGSQVLGCSGGSPCICIIRRWSCGLGDEIRRMGLLNYTNKDIHKGND
jgi:hypothetical protein